MPKLRKILGSIACSLGEHDEYIHQNYDGNGKKIGFNKRCQRCGKVIPC